MDILLQYPVGYVIAALRNNDGILHDLYQINLLSEKQMKLINNTSIVNKYGVLSIMMSENILNGDKNDFSKLTAYLESYSSVKYVVQYWKKICE